jgi:hypothetical protein
LAINVLYRLSFFADFFFADFRAVLTALFARALLEDFFAFLLFALDLTTDFLAFFTAFATVLTRGLFAAAFLTRLTTAFAAVFASTVAPLTTRSPTISLMFCFGSAAFGCSAFDSSGLFSVSMSPSLIANSS